MTVLVNNQSLHSNLDSFLLSYGPSVEPEEGDCKFCSASHSGVGIITLAAESLLTNQLLLVGNLIVLMAVHINDLNTISIYNKVFLGIFGFAITTSPVMQQRQQSSHQENCARWACDAQVQQAQQ